VQEVVTAAIHIRSLLSRAATVAAVLLLASAVVVAARNGSTAPSAVTNAAELTAALLSGGAIRLMPGRYVGNFVVSVDGTTLVGRDALPDARVQPPDVAGVVLAPADPQTPALRITASRSTVTGLTVVNGAADRAALVVGSDTATAALEQPGDVTLDRIAVLAGESGGVRGIALHTRKVTLSRSHVAGFWYRGRDAQAVLVVNGPGPYILRDNYLEGSGENVMFGGASIRIRDCVPSDVEIVGNTLAKPDTWRTMKGTVKNSLEFKAVRRALVENNVIDGSWKDAQDGSAILLTPRNQYGDTPWVVVEDVTIRGNVVRRTTDGYAVSILGRDNNHPSGQTARVTIERNLFKDARNGIRVIGGVDGALTVRRNTFPAIAYNWFAFSGTGPQTPLAVTGNVTRSGSYGISGNGSTPVGTPSLALTRIVAFSGNVIERTAERTVSWPDGNTLLAPGALATLLDQQFRHPDANIGY
jgi:Right handed beta helix region